jgi:protein-S-isoprenylcysteine O-methyltransferase
MEPKACLAAALAVAVVDAFGARGTPWQGPGVRTLRWTLALGGVALRLWSMRTLAGAFSYDLKAAAGQELVRAGPYRWLRHPAYAGMLLWSVGLATWNPSLSGLALILPATLVQLAARIGHEERLLADQFGARWPEYAAPASKAIPGTW